MYSSAQGYGSSPSTSQGQQISPKDNNPSAPKITPVKIKRRLGQDYFASPYSKSDIESTTPKSVTTREAEKTVKSAVNTNDTKLKYLISMLYDIDLYLYFTSYEKPYKTKVRKNSEEAYNKIYEFVNDILINVTQEQANNIFCKLNNLPQAIFNKSSYKVDTSLDTLLQYSTNFNITSIIKVLFELNLISIDFIERQHKIATGRKLL